MTQFKNICYRILMVTISLFVFYLVLSAGGNKSLTPENKCLLIFLAIIEIESQIIVHMSNVIHDARLSGNESYINFIHRQEDDIFDTKAENEQLRRDLAFEQGKAGVTELYLQKFTDKRTMSDARTVNEQNGKFVSAGDSGMTREEKYRAAYSLHVDGWSNADIARELKIGSGSVKVYISNGKKSYQQKRDYEHTAFNPETGVYTQDGMRPEDTSESS